jgi:hypothetical protein
MTQSTANPFPQVKTADGRSLVVFARVIDTPATLAASVPPNGKTMFFCEIHRMVYDPRRSACPGCEGGRDADQ